VLINTFLLTFTFVPYQVMRLEKQVLTYSVMSFLRTAITLILKIWLVVGAGWGLTGFAAEAFDFQGQHNPDIHSLSQLTPGRYLSTPDLWIGLAVAAVFIFAAVRLRRYRGPI